MRPGIRPSDDLQVFAARDYLLRRFQSDRKGRGPQELLERVTSYLEGRTPQAPTPLWLSGLPARFPALLESAELRGRLRAELADWAAGQADPRPAAVPVGGVAARRSFLVPATLVAGLSLAVVGLSLWAISLRRHPSQEPRTLINLPIEHLRLDERVRSVPVLSPATESSHFFLILRLPSEVRGERFTLELTAPEGGRALRVSGLRPNQLHELTLAVPLDALPPGDYLLHLEREDSGEMAIGGARIRIE